jgi:hypothetical protein
MHSVFEGLVASLGLRLNRTAAAAEDDSVWLRADQRFDICARWLSDDHCLQLAAVVRPPADGTSIASIGAGADAGADVAADVHAHADADANADADADADANADADADADAWWREDSTWGEWRHATAWHLPSSFVILIARAEARALDAASLPEFVSGFIDHLQVVDRQFNETGTPPGDGEFLEFNSVE